MVERIFRKGKWITVRPTRILRQSRSKGNLRYVVTSTTDARRHYVVSRKAGKWACSCPGWIYQLRPDEGIFHREPCRHILLLQRGR